MSKLPDLKDFLTVLNKHLRPGLPKYIALRDAVIEMASSGAWPSGMRLMTEAQWAQELPISLGPSTTVYDAANEVTGTGYVAGGQLLTGVTISASENGVVYVNFDNVVWDHER